MSCHFHIYYRTRIHASVEHLMYHIVHLKCFIPIITLSAAHLLERTGLIIVLYHVMF